MGEGGLSWSDVDRFVVLVGWGDWDGGWDDTHDGSCFGFGQYFLLFFVIYMIVVNDKQTHTLSIICMDLLFDDVLDSPMISTDQRSIIKDLIS